MKAAQDRGLQLQMTEGQRKPHFKLRTVSMSEFKTQSKNDTLEKFHISYVASSNL